jgi:hypothetical protein
MISCFPFPSRDVTNQTLHGREYFNNSQPGRVLSVTSRLGAGKRIIFLNSVVVRTAEEQEDEKQENKKQEDYRRKTRMSGKTRRAGRFSEEE